MKWLFENDILMFLFIAIPWFIGVSYVLCLIGGAFWNWLWKGMDDERRYEYIKVAKW